MRDERGRAERAADESAHASEQRDTLKHHLVQQRRLAKALEEERDTLLEQLERSHALNVNQDAALAAAIARTERGSQRASGRRKPPAPAPERQQRSPQQRSPQQRSPQQRLEEPLVNAPPSYARLRPAPLKIPPFGAKAPKPVALSAAARAPPASPPRAPVAYAPPPTASPTASPLRSPASASRPSWRR